MTMMGYIARFWLRGDI